jgi:hypothetical protein
MVASRACVLFGSQDHALAVEAAMRRPISGPHEGDLVEAVKEETGRYTDR